MDLVSILVQLAAGAVGGNAAGSAMQNRGLSTAGRSAIGAIGGLILGQVVERFTGGAISAGAVAQATQGMDIGGLITNLLSSGAGGALLTAVVSMLKSRA
jgi:hypothetical protein